MSSQDWAGGGVCISAGKGKKPCVNTYVCLPCVPPPQKSAAALDRVEEAQAVAGTEQELFLGLCSPRRGRGGERNGIHTLCRTYMKTVHAFAGLFLSPRSLAGWLCLCAGLTHGSHFGNQGRAVA